MKLPYKPIKKSLSEAFGWLPERRLEYHDKHPLTLNWVSLPQLAGFQGLNLT
jgi:hypothetical protein